MPTASDEQRAEFGIDDGPVIRFLEGRGYVRTSAWEWTMPEGRDIPTPKEWRAIVFLGDEWDWGWLDASSAARVREILGEPDSF